MGKRLDLVGQRFGRLVVIEFADNDKRGKSQFLCLCDCGKKVIVAGNSLRRNLTKSCGCLRNEFIERSKENLVGRKFGKLFVLKSAGANKWRNSRWLCLCDCGNRLVVLVGSLKSGNTKSCGCLQKKVARETVIKRNKSGKYSPNYTHGQSKTLAYKCQKAMKHKTLKKNQIADNYDREKVNYIYRVCEIINGLEDKEYVVDHWKPLNKGGEHGQDNLQILLKSLNREKGDKWPLTEEEKIRYKGFRL